MNFNELNLSPELAQAIAEMGFTEATPIQAESIPLIMSGRDLIGQAQTGTGKTAAFGIPLLEFIEAGDPAASAVVLCPTRELALQVSVELQRLARFKKGIRIAAIYGGESIQNQFRELRKHPQVIVGTPGRVADHIERGTLDFSHTGMVVLDEADEMLNMGFRDDIEALLALMPEARQTVLFSATMPPPIMELARKFQQDPAHVRVVRENLTNTSIDQFYFDTRTSAKTEIIARLLDVHSLTRVIVFCNTKRQVDELVAELQEHGLSADAIHGDLSQGQRNAVLGRFRNGTLSMLVATDVAARGIDVSDVEAVFNYDMPLDPEYYVHRIGRTGRAGKSGLAFSFVTGRNEMRRLRDIEAYARMKVLRQDAPTLRDLRDARKLRLRRELAELIEAGDLGPFTRMVEGYEREGIDAQQLAAALLKLTLDRDPVARMSDEALLPPPRAPRKPDYPQPQYGNRRYREPVR
ncbi:MAG: DEAD/DEAH box helicase [Bacteroidia bacterium]|nr:DEAD/DEAH box helicase [Bacteroidia bacterium]